jgi:hypothetical protein
MNKSVDQYGTSLEEQMLSHLHLVVILMSQFFTCHRSDKIVETMALNGVIAVTNKQIK